MGKSKKRFGFLIVFAMLLCSTLSVGLLFMPNHNKTTEALSEDVSPTAQVVLSDESDFIIDAAGVLTGLSETGKQKIGSSYYEITIPARVTEIRNATDEFYATTFPTNLVKVNFAADSQLTTIGNNAFYNQGLTEIDIPASVETIGDGAFSYNSSLQRVHFAEDSKLNSIGTGAFVSCALQSITIPASVEEINKQAFNYCRQLETVNFDENGHLRIIGDEAFYMCNLKEINAFPNSLISIGKRAFIVANFTSITIPASVEEIGESAFQRCTFESITFDPNGNMQVIGTQAFYNCESLTGEITLPKALTEIGDRAFSMCPKISKIVDDGNALNRIGIEAFKGCDQLGEFYLPSSITEIGESAFYECKNMKSSLCLSNLQSIGKNAFYFCQQLESCYSSYGPDRLESIPERTFYACHSLRTVQLPFSLKSIGNEAFRGCIVLKSLEFPDSLQSIGPYAFAECAVLGETDYYNERPINIFCKSLTSIGEGAFADCTSLYRVTLDPECGLREIGQGAFKGCKKLSRVTLPETLNTISAEVFSGCSSLTSNSKIPESVTNIGNKAFENCDLRYVYLPNVTSLGYDAFKDCKILTSVYAPKLRLINNSFGLGTTENPTNENLQVVVVASGYTVTNNDQYRDRILSKITSVININLLHGNTITDTIPKLDKRSIKWCLCESKEYDYAGLLYWEEKPSYMLYSGKRIGAHNTYYTSSEISELLEAGEIEDGYRLTDKKLITDEEAFRITYGWGVYDEQTTKFTGNDYFPQVLVYNLETRSYVQKEDYTIFYHYMGGTWYPTETEMVPNRVGTYKIIIYCWPSSELCQGEASTTFTITPKTLSSSDFLSIESRVYDGTDYKPTPVFKAQYVPTDADYTLTYSDNLSNVGTKTITITAKEGGNFTGSITLQYSITKRDMSSDLSVTFTEPQLAYTGKKIEPGIADVILTYDGDKTLHIPAEAYTLSFGENLNAGQGTVTLTANSDGNYTGECTITFNIAKRSISEGLTFDIPNVPITYGVFVPRPGVLNVVLTFGEGQTIDLTEGEDFEVRYVDPGRVGTVQVIVKALESSNFAGQSIGTYQIVPRSINEGLTITLEQQEYAYAGSQVQPAIKSAVLTYQDGGEMNMPLNAEDYTLTFGENLNIGQGTVTLTAKEGSGFTGSVSTNFTIVQAQNKLVEAFNLRELIIGSDTKEPDIKSQFGEVTVKYLDASGNEYTFNELKQIAKPGTYKAVVTVDGTDNYSELSLEFTFEVKNKAPSNIMWIAIGVGGAAVVAVGGVITLILLRRRKKLKLKNS